MLDYCPAWRFKRALSFDEGREDWYHWAGIKYFLYEYEEHLAGRREVRLPWDRVEKRQNTIEHIVPQTLTDEYWNSRFDDEKQARLTHDIGNLCLTYDNSSYGNKPFPDKKGGPETDEPCYWASVLFQEQELAKLAEWNPEDLLKRRRIMEWALRRWHVEEITPAEPDLDEEEEAMMLKEEDELDSLLISP